MGYSPAVFTPTPVADMGWQENAAARDASLADMAEAFLFDTASRPGSGSYAGASLGRGSPPTSQPAPPPAVPVDAPAPSGGPPGVQVLPPPREYPGSLPQVTPLVEPVDTLEPGRPPGYAPPAVQDAPSAGPPAMGMGGGGLPGGYVAQTGINRAPTAPQTFPQGGNGVSPPGLAGVGSGGEKLPSAPSQGANGGYQPPTGQLPSSGAQGVGAVAPREHGSVAGPFDAAAEGSAQLGKVGDQNDTGANLGGAEGSGVTGASGSVTTSPPC
jgi:hypothetical protein